MATYGGCCSHFLTIHQRYKVIFCCFHGIKIAVVCNIWVFRLLTKTFTFIWMKTSSWSEKIGLADNIQTKHSRIYSIIHISLISKTKRKKDHACHLNIKLESNLSIPLWLSKKKSANIYKTLPHSQQVWRIHSGSSFNLTQRKYKNKNHNKKTKKTKQ